MGKVLPSGAGRMKKRIAFLLIAAILIGSGIYTYVRFAWDSPHRGDIVLYGNVDIRDVSLGFRVAGRIEKLLREEGDRVAKGDLLAVLDKGPFTEEMRLRQAELNEARAVFLNARQLYERQKSLLAEGATSQEAHHSALFAFEGARARVETIQAALNLAHLNWKDTEIYAPDSGIILTRVRERGSVVAQGMTVYTLALDDPVWIRTYIDEPRLGFVYPGQQARITTDSGGSYTGQVGFISPQAEFTPKSVETAQLRTDLVYRMRVIVSSADTGLRQGMPVTITLEP